MKIEHTYEISYWQQGYQHIIGLDEAAEALLQVL